MFSYGQRSKCSDLLNSYNSAYICISDVNCEKKQVYIGVFHLQTCFYYA